MWRSLVDYLAGRFRILTPDLPGYGNLGMPEVSGPLGPELAAVAALAAHAGRPVHIVGHGFGGVVALEAARRMPELVRSLTLIEPAAFHLLDRTAQGDGALGREIDALTGRVCADIAWDDPEGAAARIVDYWSGCGAWARTSAGLREFLLACLPQAMRNLSAVRALPVIDYAGIACPTLAVMGLELAAALDACHRDRRRQHPRRRARDHPRRRPHGAADRPAPARPDDRRAPASPGPAPPRVAS